MNPIGSEALKTTLAATLRWLLVAVVLLLSPFCVFATTVIPPDFDSLVKQADYIVEGTVKSVTSEWRNESGNRNIITKVEVDVSEVIKGTPPQPLVLEMLGGRIGDIVMKIDGAPEFKAGEKHILFVRGNGQQFVPLVALMHGQYPIRKDASGAEYVSRSNGDPLYNEAEVALPMHASAMTPALRAATEASARPLVPAEFGRRIKASAAAGGK